MCVSEDVCGVNVCLHVCMCVSCVCACVCASVRVRMSARVFVVRHSLYLLSSALDLNMMIMVKFDWFSLVYQRPKPCGCVECWDTCTSSSHPLCKGTLQQ